MLIAKNRPKSTCFGGGNRCFPTWMVGRETGASDVSLASLIDMRMILINIWHLKFLESAW